MNGKTKSVILLDEVAWGNDDPRIDAEDERSVKMSEDINDALCDAYDIQKSFDFKKIADRPKDNDGTSITLKDCIDNIVYRLEALKEKGSQELSKEDT